MGSHACLKLAEAGFNPITYDNLSRGWAEFVQWGPLEVGDIRDRARLSEVFESYSPVAVVHFAALSEVGESTKSPSAYLDNNVGGSCALIDVACRAGCTKFVFSSTCAVYGTPMKLPLVEQHSRVPLSPYGRSKMLVEDCLSEVETWSSFRSVILRYFNAAGADPLGRIGEKHQPETHAIPNAIFAAMGRGEFNLFGVDYETRDGTAIRDYVHVLDLADAHVEAVKHLLTTEKSLVLNLGTGHGTTVRELIHAVRSVSGVPFAARELPRRSGDAPVLVANSLMAADALGWRPRFGFDAIVESAWRWHTR